MSAMPDLRLQATPEVKSKAKQPAKAPEPSRNEASGFAEVYAKERQSKSAERAGPSAKPTEERPVSAAGEPAASAETAGEASDPTSGPYAATRYCSASFLMSGRVSRSAEIL